MPSELFSIEITDSKRICDNSDDPQDLCSHGHVTLRYGDKILAEENVSTSASALMLMRSLEGGHIPNPKGPPQLLPCCGHTMLPQEDSDDVLLLGCPSGIDPEVRHFGEMIVLTFKDGIKVKISREEYASAVLEFVHAVEDFYAACSPKILPDDDFERRGYELFWSEWRRRKKRLFGESEFRVPAFLDLQIPV